MSRRDDRRPLAPADAVRAFVALELPASLRAEIGRRMAEERHRFAGLRWVRPETLHLTLRFLGQTSPGQVDALRESLRPLAARCPRVDVPVGGLGLFPERGSPRILWLALQLPEPVLELQAACEAAAVRAGFPPETRPFTPHLTLGRWRERAARPELPAVDLGQAPLETLVLFRSDLEPGGAVHTPLTRFDLARG